MEDSLDKGYDYDLLFVDDGSKDNTIDHVQHLASLDQHVKYISFTEILVKNDMVFDSVKCDRGDGRWRFTTSTRIHSTNDRRIPRGV